MPIARETIIVDPRGRSMDVTITDAADNAVTVYDAVAGGSAVSFPDTITSAKMYHLIYGGDYKVSAKIKTLEVAGSNGAKAVVGARYGVPVTVVPTVDAGAALDVAEGASSGGSVALPAPNLAVGSKGAFGVSLEITPQSVPAGVHAVMLDSAYTLASADPANAAVNNAYMAWDPVADATLITIKQAGWYSVYVEVDLDANAASPLELFINQVSGGGISHLPLTTVPAGDSTASGIWIAYMEADAVLVSKVFNAGVSAVQIDDAFLLLTPLFALA